MQAAGYGGEHWLVHVEFARRKGGGSLATIDRPDGVRLLLTSYDRANTVPHDLAHFVAERDLGLRRGLWGSIASGALFDSLQLISGKRRHNDAAPITGGPPGERRRAGSRRGPGRSGAPRPAAE